MLIDNGNQINGDDIKEYNEGFVFNTSDKLLYKTDEYVFVYSKLHEALFGNNGKDIEEKYRIACQKQSTLSSQPQE